MVKRKYLILVVVVLIFASLLSGCAAWLKSWSNEPEPHGVATKLRIETLYGGRENVTLNSGESCTILARGVDGNRHIFDLPKYKNVDWSLGDPLKIISGGIATRNTQVKIEPNGITCRVRAIADISPWLPVTINVSTENSEGERIFGSFAVAGKK